MTEFAFLGTETPAEWDDWRLDNAVVDDGTVRLRSEALPAYVDPREAVTVPDTDSPIAAIDVDDCGDLYLLRESGVIQRYDADRGVVHRFECAGVDLSRGRGRDLLVTADTIYVADAMPGEEEAGDPAEGDEAGDEEEEAGDLAEGDGDEEDETGDGDSGEDSGYEGRLVALSRHLRQTRWVITDPGAVPVALAAWGDEVYTLFETDVDGFLDRVDPDGSRHRVVEQLEAPRDVAFDEAGFCHLLDEEDGDPVLRRVDGGRFSPDGPLSGPATWGAPVPTGASCLAAGREGELLVGCRDTPGGTATLFRVQPSERDALGGVEWDIAQLELDGTLYALADRGRTVQTLDARERFRRDETTGGYDARLIRSFDSGEPGVQWHRVTLGFAAAGSASQVRLSYAASDERVSSRDVDWQELEPANPHDALLDDAKGRYLWVRIELVGGVYETPTLETFRAYFPQQSYLRYLPAIYREDAESRAFLERYLSLFESTFVDIEEQIEAVTRFFDPEGIPPEYLSWLEAWLALETDESWPSPARRRLLKQAPELFRKRGTPDGLLDLVDIYLDAVADPSPGWLAHIERQLDSVSDRGELSPADARTLRRRIESNSFLLEYADLDCVEGEAREAYTRLIECPQCFFVFVRPFVTDEELETIQTLVDENRPAHAVGQVVELEPSILLGGHSYLGINSVLPERDLAVGRGNLGQDSVLDERETAGQLEVRSRLGEDTRLS